MSISHSFIESLQWRYATKRMNGKIIPDSVLNQILEAIRLSPSSLGLQPYSIVVVSDRTLLSRINQAACTQPQIVEGSHLLVFAALENLDDKSVESFIELNRKLRGLAEEEADRLRIRVNNFVGSKQAVPQAFFNWSARQAYIALGFGLAAAAIQQIDATPMEGFNPDLMDEVLELKSSGLRSVALLMLGYRNAGSDYLTGVAKVRQPADRLFVRRNG